MIHDRVRMTLFGLHLRLGLRLPAYLRNISVRTAYTHAKKSYRPATPFGGELLLLRATSGVGNDEPYVNRYVDPLLGWSPRTTHGLRVVDVPGGHSSMLQEPNAQGPGRTPAALYERCDQAGGGPRWPRRRPARRAEAEDSRPPRPFQLLLVSASSREDLDDAAGRLAGYVQGARRRTCPTWPTRWPWGGRAWSGAGRPSAAAAKNCSSGCARGPVGAPARRRGRIDI